MIVGLGIDVASIARLGSGLSRFGDRFWNRVLTERERLDLAERGGNRAEALAGRFAAKEATIKALGAPPGIGLHHVEVRRGAGGAPELFLFGVAREKADRLGVDRVHVSITHDVGIAAAVVVLERTGLTT